MDLRLDHGSNYIRPNASGIADEKKDYVRSQVAQLDEKIALAEAEIEKAYNNIRVLELEYSDE